MSKYEIWMLALTILIAANALNMLLSGLMA